MRKKLVVFVAAMTAAAVILCAAGLIAIQRAQQEEMKRVENLAGAVLSEYPEAEETFAAAVMDSDLKTLEAGADIMSHYGYDEDMAAGERYTKDIYIYVSICAMILAISAGFGCAVFYGAMKKRRQQEKTILFMLDECLSGDFAFAYEESQLAELENPAFADSMAKLAHSLKLKTDRLDEERDSTKTMVTDISHQLKTPISALRVCLDMYDEAGSDEERSEFFDRSVMQLEKLESLTAALVNISRLESDMITLRQEPVMLSEILVNAVNSVYHKALAKKINIETSDFEDTELYLDRKWTAEAVFNILDNAVKYSGEGGNVRITVTGMFSFVRIEIADEGIGVPPHEQNKIWRRFYRGGSDAVRCEEGSGVGLYLCRSIIERQSGTVTVKAGRSGGSVFVLQLPLAR